MNTPKQKEWFVEWFNSPYYHLLYEYRNDKEAEFFIDNITSQIKLAAGAKLIDVCCGKGRHAVYLNKKGFDVTGVDIAAESIEQASKFRNKTLAFYVHDMRKPFKENYFNAAFNLFTSFGYFDNITEETKMLLSINNALKPGGILVIDYLNSEKICSISQPDEVKTINNIHFSISKKVIENIIIKTIEVDDNGTKKHYNEKVRLFTLSDFEMLLTNSGFKLISTFGDYNLNPYNNSQSDRLILIAAKR